MLKHWSWAVNMDLQCGGCIKSNISNKIQDTGKLILALCRLAKIELQKSKVFLHPRCTRPVSIKSRPQSGFWAALSSKSLANTIQDFISVLDHEWNLFSGKNAYLHSISQLRGIQSWSLVAVRLVQLRSDLCRWYLATERLDIFTIAIMFEIHS